MRAFADIHPDSSPKLVWLVTLLAAAAIVMTPGTAFGADECAADAQGCVEVAAAPDPATTPPDPPPVVEATGVSEDPPVAQPTPPVEPETPVTPTVPDPATPVEPTTTVPTPRIDPGPAPVEPEPAVVIAETEAAPAPPATPPATPPNLPLAPDAAPTAAQSPFAATANTPDGPDVAPPSTPAAPTSTVQAAASRPDTLSISIPDAPPPASKDAVVAPPPTKSKFGPGVFTKDPGSDGAFAKDIQENLAAAIASPDAVETVTPSMALAEKIFSTANAWTPELVGPSDDLLETLATYLVPGEGGSYTATLAALLQLAFVLVALALLRPRRLSSPLSPLRASQRAGYRAVVFRPG